MAELKHIEQVIVADVTSSLVTQNAVGSINIPSSPPISVSFPYLMVLCAFICALSFTDRMIHKNSPIVIVTREFKTFQNSYVNVYLCALGTEWLQDSHLLALLLRRGYSVDKVAYLFIVSFVVTFACEQFGFRVFGRNAGFLGGSRNACLLCFGLYVLSGFTIFHDEYHSLLLGRIFYGIATALLHTTFDAWMSSEHMKNAFPDEWLMQTYQNVGRKTVIVAVGSGVVAEVCASYAGLAAPFLASMGCSLMGMITVSNSWPKNVHDKPCSYESLAECSDDGIMGTLFTALTSFLTALSELMSSSSGRTALHVVIVQAFFETSMYVTMFMWTPTLNASTIEYMGIGVPPPYGIIFSILMAALMLGSHIFQVAFSSMEPETVCFRMCCVAACAILVLALCGTSAHWVLITALILFQFCVGIYYPVIGHLRGHHIPFEQRSAAGDLSKTILAILVVLILLNFASMVHLTHCYIPSCH